MPLGAQTRVSRPGIISCLWAQMKLDEKLSPPSPQIQMTVRQTAIQFSATRLSYEILYLIFFTITLILAFGLVLYNIFHGIEGKKKYRQFMKEVREVEESVRRGFAVLRRDIRAELAIVRKARLSKSLSAEEKTKEEQFLKDLEGVEKYIGKEVWDVEHTEPTPVNTFINTSSTIVGEVLKPSRTEFY